MKRIVLYSVLLAVLLCALFALTSCSHKHSPMTVTYEKTPASCTERGIDEIVVTCVDCGEELSRTPAVHAKLPHNESAWIVDLESTCQEVGSQHKECVDCGTVLMTEEIPLGDIHTTPEIDEAVAPTDTEDGRTAGSHCAECGAVIVEQEIIPALLQGTSIKSGVLEALDDEHPEQLAATVTNDTTIFSFLNDIVVARDAQYILSTDIGCISSIPSKTVKLNVGINTFYILVANQGEYCLYYITITRMS